jgi:transposase
MGERLPSCSVQAFVHKAAPQIPDGVRPALDPVVTMIAELNKQIAGYDAEIERLAKERYPEAAGPRQVNGVGPITFLAYLLTIEDPRRFRWSRDVGSYLGLTPRRDQSGQSASSTSRQQVTSSCAGS